MGLSEIKARIIAAAQAAGRDPASVQLIAVSKLQPEAQVRAALTEGQRLFGENYVQEAGAKWPALRAEFPGTQVHMIGPLQSNKARLAFSLFEAIHTLDRPSLADKIAHLAQEMGHCPQLFVQVNTGREPQKAGLLPEDLAPFLARLRAQDLRPEGLMCIPPEGEDSRPHFRALAALARDHGLPGLSMGMSGDFEAAIAEGATYVRVGSALFGARPPKGG